MGVITLDDCARPKEQRATFHADIASRKLSIVKKEKKKRPMAASRCAVIRSFMHRVYKEFER